MKENLSNHWPGCQDGLPERKKYSSIILYTYFIIFYNNFISFWLFISFTSLYQRGGNEYTSSLLIEFWNRLEPYLPDVVSRPNIRKPIDISGTIHNVCPFNVREKLVKYLLTITFNQFWNKMPSNDLLHNATIIILIRNYFSDTDVCKLNVSCNIQIQYCWRTILILYRIFL